MLHLSAYYINYKLKIKNWDIATNQIALSAKAGIHHAEIPMVTKQGW